MRITARAWAITSILLGGIWVVQILAPPTIQLVSAPEELWTKLFVMMLSILLAIPGAIAFHYGGRLLREVSTRSLRASVGAISICGILLLQTVIAPLFPEGSAVLVAMLAAIFLVTPIYIRFTKLLVRRELRQRIGTGDLVGKGTLVVFSLVLMSALGALAELSVPGHMEPDYVISLPWGPILAFGPTLVGWLFYRLAGRIVASEDRRQTTPPSSCTPVQGRPTQRQGVEPPRTGAEPPYRPGSVQRT
jgi:hypothetical protein